MAASGSLVDGDVEPAHRGANVRREERADGGETGLVRERLVRQEQPLRREGGVGGREQLPGPSPRPSRRAGSRTRRASLPRAASPRRRSCSTGAGRELVRDRPPGAPGPSAWRRPGRAGPRATRKSAPRARAGPRLTAPHPAERSRRARPGPRGRGPSAKRTGSPSGGPIELHADREPFPRDARRNRHGRQPREARRHGEDVREVHREGVLGLRSEREGRLRATSGRGSRRPPGTPRRSRASGARGRAAPGRSRRRGSPTRARTCRAGSAVSPRGRIPRTRDFR